MNNLIIYHRHYYYSHCVQESTYNGDKDWALLGFVVITAISLYTAIAFGMAFTRREKTLAEIAKFRLFSFQLYK